MDELEKYLNHLIYIAEDNKRKTEIAKRKRIIKEGIRLLPEEECILDSFKKDFDYESLKENEPDVIKRCIAGIYIVIFAVAIVCRAWIISLICLIVLVKLCHDVKSEKLINESKKHVINAIEGIKWRLDCDEEKAKEVYLELFKAELVMRREEKCQTEWKNWKKK